MDDTNTNTGMLFGRMPDGTAVTRHHLAVPGGLEADILNYGGILAALRAPDDAGRRADVVLGFDTLEEYRAANAYFGAIVGRHAGLMRGQFSLDGNEYRLACNDGPCHLHGGVRGFDKVVWRAEPFAGEEGPAVRLTHHSPAGDEGYPGALEVSVIYTVTTAGDLHIDYQAVTDAPTILNLTHHSYFNLAGHGNGDILDHEVAIAADAYTPIDAAMLPTGVVAPVTGTPLDFRIPRRIGDRIGEPDEQLRYGRGYDHTWVINGWDGALRRAALVREPTTGRQVEVLTTEPGLQFYTGNMMPGTLNGKAGAVYHRRYGLCLEAQHYNDGPNVPAFPSPVLRPGQVYRQTTIYRFTNC